MRYFSSVAIMVLSTSLGYRSSENAVLTLAAAQTPSSASTQSSSQERAVHAAMEELKQAVLKNDTVALKRIWTTDYAFINPQGLLVTRSQRLANFASGSTNISVIDNEREITVKVLGDVAVVQNLSTLRATYSGTATNTDLRGTAVWVRREGRWQLVTNQLTPVVK